MIWWAERPQRARAERAGIAELADRAEWLDNVRWPRRDDMDLVAQFEIIHHGEAKAFTIRYPGYFPDVPPVIAPVDDIVVSGHQYGRGGELCLEWRTDNWHPDVTGAMMIESAWRLLSGEQPAPDDYRDVASAHQLTQGQQVRNAKLRLHLESDTRVALMALPQLTLAPLAVEEYNEAGNVMARPSRIGEEEAPLWRAQTGLQRVVRTQGYAVRLPPESHIAVKADYGFLETLFAMIGDRGAIDLLAHSDVDVPVLIADHDVVRLLLLRNGTGPRSVLEYRTITFPLAQNRLSEDHQTLAQKSVAILGCGSVGSKIAASLARSGVGSFVLVDGDIFFPDNIVRNDLDWHAVALNKPDALGERLKAIAPDVTIDKRRIAFGGQESAETSQAAMLRIGRCDLIIDATADPQVFNLAASVARTERKSMIWGIVYAGGIGGLIARARPDKEPPPLLARQQIIAWGERHDMPWAGGDDGRYGTSADAEAPPLVADDADVSVIAAHMTRMAIDTLIRDESIYPFSAYAMGLQEEWIFDAPFDTWPISLALEGSWGLDITPDWVDEFTAFTAEMKADADADVEATVGADMDNPAQ
jgi:ubiquitin-protein ligase